MTIIIYRCVVETKLLLPPIAILIHFPIQSSSITVGETEAFSFVCNTTSHHRIKYLRFRRHVSTTRMTVCHLHTRMSRLLQHLMTTLVVPWLELVENHPALPLSCSWWFVIAPWHNTICFSFISLYNELVSVSVQLVGSCWRLVRPPDNLPIHVTYIINSDYAVGTSVQSTPSKCIRWDSRAYLMFSLRFLLTTNYTLLLQAFMIIGCGNYSIKKSSLTRSENSGASSKICDTKCGRYHLAIWVLCHTAFPRKTIDYALSSISTLQARSSSIISMFGWLTALLWIWQTSWMSQS